MESRPVKPQAIPLGKFGGTQNECRDKTRLAGDDGGDADFRLHRLVCADVRPAGGQRGVLALRGGGAGAAGGVRRAGAAAARCADARHAAAGDRRRRRAGDQLAAAVCRLFLCLYLHRHGGVQHPAVYTGGAGGAVSGGAADRPQAAVAGAGVRRHDAGGAGAAAAGGGTESLFGGHRAGARGGVFSTP